MGMIWIVFEGCDLFTAKCGRAALEPQVKRLAAAGMDKGGMFVYKHVCFKQFNFHVLMVYDSKSFNSENFFLVLYLNYCCFDHLPTRLRQLIFVAAD